MTQHANGKLLLTGEYFVLDGALALALPTQLGQKMSIRPNPQLGWSWKSYDHNNKLWFSAVFRLPDLELKRDKNNPIGKRLQQILRAAKQLNPVFFNKLAPLIVETHLEFPLNWGLGSSSTLINLLAQWVGVNPYVLLDLSFGGSGYDIACATAEQPIFYQKINSQVQVEPAHFHPPFQEQLYFVYLGKKQNSRAGIERYRASKAKKGQAIQTSKDFKFLIEDISAISKAIAEVSQLKTFNNLLVEHEKIVAATLKIDRAQTRYFSDYWGVIKSLGAWGGDFILATSEENEATTKSYFNKKGLDVVFRYGEMVI